MPKEAISASDDAAIKALKEKLAKFETEVGRMSAVNLKTLPTDVFIATTPKAGTTWLQQICHQLRSKGDMEFDEISCVVPYIELATDLGQDLDDKQQWTPRLFKTHFWYNSCPRGAKYIVVQRAPHDVALSFFNFFEGWWFEPGEISLHAFLSDFWLRRGAPADHMENAGYCEHLLSWYEHRNDPNVLFLFYEDLKEDLEREVRRIAAFMYPDGDDLDERVAIATRMSTYAFMKEHSGHFDEKLSKLKCNEVCGLAKDAGMQQTKLGAGESGRGRTALTPELVEAIDRKWKDVVEPVSGHATYEELRDAVRAERAAAAV